MPKLKYVTETVSETRTANIQAAQIQRICHLVFNTLKHLNSNGNTKKHLNSNSKLVHPLLLFSIHFSHC